MRRTLTLAAIAAAFAAPAFAQQAALSVGGTATATGGGGASVDMQTNQNRNQAPIGSVLGVPVVITAPVDAPYNAAGAYSTWEGQSGFGPNAVLAASDAGAP